MPNMDLHVLHEALCHTSYANEQENYANSGNERLEFLGDSVVGLTITEALYLRYPHMREGDLSKIRSVVVSKRILSERTEALDLSRCLLLGKGEEQTGGRRRFSILGNLFESVVGAIYISEGIEPAKGFVLKQLTEDLERAAAGESLIDYKSNLQERAQRDFGKLPSYRLVGTSGPDHDKEFVVEVYVGDTLLSVGKDKSKKKAEKAAAAQALECLDRARPESERIQGNNSEQVNSRPQRKRSKEIPPKGRIMAIDPGGSRIGVALSDDLRLIAQPLTTIQNTSASAVTRQIGDLVKDHQVAAVVVGLPRGLDGREGTSASLARKIGDHVRESVKVPVVFWDERFSTVASERHLIQFGVRRKDRRKIVDQFAAAWILEGYLEHLRHSASP